MRGCEQHHSIGKLRAAGCEQLSCASLAFPTLIPVAGNLAFRPMSCQVTSRRSRSHFPYVKVYPCFQPPAYPLRLSRFLRPLASRSPAMRDGNGAERMEIVAEADPPEPSSGTEQRGADPQPQVSQQMMKVCQLHTALRLAERQHQKMKAALLAEGTPLETEAWATLFLRPTNITGASLHAYRAATINAETYLSHFAKARVRVWNGKDGQVRLLRAARGASRRLTVERVCCVLARRSKLAVRSAPVTHEDSMALPRACTAQSVESREKGEGTLEEASCCMRMSPWPCAGNTLHTMRFISIILRPSDAIRKKRVYVCIYSKP